MSAHPNDSYLAQIAAGRPSIDLRAPVEFEQGAMPGAINLPILDDDERAQVGTTYKALGAEAARALGHELVAGETKAARIAGWREVLLATPEALLYCWRGGERSQTAAQWLAECGLQPTRVPGGYKALRRACVDVLEVTPEDTAHWWVLAGRTGSGKTLVLPDIRTAIDLEGLANHRGSAFGGKPTAQPTPATFENVLATRILPRRKNFTVLEDESRTIGRLALPEAVHNAMQAAPIVLLEAPMDARVANIRREYVDLALEATPAGALFATYADSLRRIQKRLGGVRYREILAALERGFDHGEHDRWIELLLSWYYDPMYDYQLERKAERVRHRCAPHEAAALINGLAERA